ncbi:MAG: tRNA-dihydrouridine synthase family protein [Candidatus Aegiribacteria sp.]|nr:tRNA-dihydrouridine synthase family protein [Candidatus Aegiribacteria sp.]
MYMFAFMENSAFSEYTHGVVLAPMAGSTDSAFRRICRRMGATAVVTEMVAAAGLSRKSVKSHKLLRFHAEEKPIGVQLFGSRPGDFEGAAGIVSEMGFDFIDINAGCPVKKVVSSGSGSALLRNIPALAAIVRAVSSQTSLPVTVKIRIGWSPSEPVPDSLPAILADEGASAIAVHGRYRSDMFAGEVRKSEIERIVRRSPVPVIANGDSRSVCDSLELMDATGASGLMIGRGALGNPWIFRGLAAGKPEDDSPLPDEVVSIIWQQYEMMSKYIPVNHLYHVLRGQLLHYIKGFRGAADLRGRAVGVDCGEDLSDILSELKELLNLERQRNNE